MPSIHRWPVVNSSHHNCSYEREMDTHISLWVCQPLLFLSQVDISTGMTRAHILDIIPVLLFEVSSWFWISQLVQSEAMWLVVRSLKHTGKMKRRTHWANPPPDGHLSSDHMTPPSWVSTSCPLPAYGAICQSQRGYSALRVLLFGCQLIKIF